MNIHKNEMAVQKLNIIFSVILYIILLEYSENILGVDIDQLNQSPIIY